MVALRGGGGLIAVAASELVPSLRKSLRLIRSTMNKFYYFGQIFSTSWVLKK
jgi:hypothetical protein